METVRAECADKIGQVVEATRTARAALDDARAATHKSLDSLRTELYGALDQRSDDWRDDRADLVRGLARCDRAIGAIEGKLDMAKTTARAFAEEAPAVKRAGALAGCYAALLVQTSGRAEAALDVLDLLGFQGGGRDVRGFAEALAENAKDADAALKLLATLTGRSDVRSTFAESAAGRIHLELAARAAQSLAERADDEDAAAVRRHVASVAPPRE